MKVVTAGRLVRGVVYTMNVPQDGPKARSAKRQISSAARERMNLTQSWEKLEAVLAANFKYSDLHVTLTYRNEDLPPDRAAAKKQLKKFVAQLRAYRRPRGEPLKYVYATEGQHGEARLHHHIVINGTGADFDVIRSLWIYGDDIDFELVGVPGYTVLAQYLTKEPREYGKPETGERTWTPSLGLKKPKTDTDYVKDNITLTAPPGAIILDRAEKQNGFGEYLYIKYLLPEPPEDLPQRYRRPQRPRK
jgi:hypothetical protein